MYATDDAGKRVVCKHPGEWNQAHDVIGGDATEEKFRERTGFLSNCVCSDCLAQFRLDLERDERICEKCGSGNVKSTNESVGSQCPKCKVGVIQAEDTGAIS